jgi:hypothetical protein
MFPRRDLHAQTSMIPYIRNLNSFQDRDDTSSFLSDRLSYPDILDCLGGGSNRQPSPCRRECSYGFSGHISCLGCFSGFSNRCGAILKEISIVMGEHKHALMISSIRSRVNCPSGSLCHDDVPHKSVHPVTCAQAT